MPPRGKRGATCLARGRVVEIELRSFDGVTQLFRGDLRVHGEGAGRRIVRSLRRRRRRQGAARCRPAQRPHGSAGQPHGGRRARLQQPADGARRQSLPLGEELREQPRVFEKLKAARDAGKRGTELIKQLMTFARREELEVGVDRSAESHRRSCCRLLRRALGVRITLETKLQANVGAVRASVAQLESAVVNLAVNARDAIEGKGRISIEVGRRRRERSKRPRCAGSRAAGATSPSACAIPAAVSRRKRSAGCSSRSSRPRASAAARGLGSAWCVGSRSTPAARAAIDSVVGQGTTVTLAAAAPPGGAVSRRQRYDNAVVDAADGHASASWCSRWTKRLRATIHQTLEVLGYRVKVASGAEDLLAAVARRADRAC